VKIKKTVLQFTGIFTLLLLIQFELISCPKCNQDFYNELLGQRANTLGGQELLEAIKNQSTPGQPSNFVLPSANNNLTDIKQSNDQGVSGSNNINNSQAKPQTNYYPYIYLIAQLMFPGHLFS
jgi:hypothetical protein